MEFNPGSTSIRLCLLAMEAQAKDNVDEARRLFMEAWNKAGNSLEQFIAAHLVGRSQTDLHQRLQWLQTALVTGLQIKTVPVSSGLSSLYFDIATSYEQLQEANEAATYREQAKVFGNKLQDEGPFYHGTRVSLQTGDLLTAGGASNYQDRLIMNHIYFTASVSGAAMAAALAKGDEPERVYIVTPTGIFENDPNVTDKKFPGNPTRSYRSKSPLKITGEVTSHVAMDADAITKWKEKIRNNSGTIIN